MIDAPIMSIIAAALANTIKAAVIDFAPIAI